MILLPDVSLSASWAGAAVTWLTYMLENVDWLETELGE